MVGGLARPEVELPASVAMPSRLAQDDDDDIVVSFLGSDPEWAADPPVAAQRRT